MVKTSWSDVVLCQTVHERERESVVPFAPNRLNRGCGHAFVGGEHVIQPTHAANVHVDISIPNFGIQEMVFFPEVAREVIPGGPEFKDGYMNVSDSPGLGVDINEAAAKKYPYRRAYLPTARRKDGSVQDW